MTGWFKLKTIEHRYGYTCNVHGYQESDIKKLISHIDHGIQPDVQYLCCKPSEILTKRIMILSIAISLGLFFFFVALRVLIQGLHP